MERYYIAKPPPPLTYNDAIYWHDGAWYFEQPGSRDMVRRFGRERDWVYREARALLDHACQQKARELGWHAYHTEEEERQDDLYIYFRCTMYACPGWREIKLWRVPHAVYTLSLKPQDGPIIHLPLRRLHYHGQPAWAALHEDVLHVALR